MNTDSAVLGDRQGHPSSRVADGFQQADSGIGLACISGGGDFETVREWCNAVAEVCHSISIPDYLLVKSKITTSGRNWTAVVSSIRYRT